MKIKRFLLLGVVVVLISVFAYKSVFAAGSGGGTSNPSSGGAISCNPMPNGWSTCKGGSWFVIPWDSSWSSYHENGSGKSTHAFTIEGETARYCAEAGYIFKYTLVNHPSNTAVSGAIAIYHGAGSSFNSKKIGGSMPYLGDQGIGISWEDAEAAYNEAVATYGSVPGTDGFSNTSTTSWFCASYGGTSIRPCPEGDPECPEDTPDPKEYDCPEIPSPQNYTSSGPLDGYSSVRTQVSKTYKGWTNTLYVKPNDTVLWRHCYFPGAQKTANTGVTYKHDHSDTVKNYPTVVENGAPLAVDKTFYASVFNTEFKNTRTFGNDFKIRYKDGSTIVQQAKDVGDYSVQIINSRGDVKQSWVGTEVYEESSLNSEPWHAYVWREDSDEWTCKFRGLCTERKSVPAHVTGTKVVCGDESSNTSPDANGNCPGGVPKNTVNEYTTDCDPTSYYHAQQQGKPYCETSVVQTVTEECDKNTKCKHAGSVQGPYAFGKADSADGSISKGAFNKNTSLTSEKATVLTPFNFNMSGTISLAGDYVYAGEAAKLKTGSVTVENRQNNTTGGTYATRVEGVKAQILTFVWGSPVTSVPAGANVRYGKEFNIGNMSENETKTLSSLGTETVSVDDEVAGTYFCVAIQVSPTSSGSDTTMSSNGFDKSYKRSGADCKPIAKRPSFQVWGGSLFSNGEIRTGRAVKNNLKGVTGRGYQVIGVNDANVFGSWVEHSVMSIGKNGGQTYLGLASASATAFSGAINKNTNYEKSPKSGLCTNESNLSFANAAAGGISICGIDQKTNGFFTTNRAKVDKKSIVTDIWPTVEKDKNVSSLTIGSDGSYKQQMTVNGKLVRYTYASNKLTINTSNDITVGKTGGNNKETATSYIIWADKDVYINGNITYKNDTYTNLDKMPKVVIYSAGNIYVGCHVERIDAVLIAEKNFDSCTDADGKNPGINTTARRNQLRINGSLIADRIRLTRTYGAGPGQQSGDPAEIINYDTSLIIWSRAQADTSASNKLNVTYTNEIAPRY